MGAVLSFANQKGGVGKTTSAVNIAACVAALGKKVLVVDLDPQGNTTSGFGIGKKELTCSTYDVIIGRAEAASAIIVTKFPGLSIMPSNIELAGAEFDLYGENDREYKLKKALAPVAADYDYIIIDCPPSLGMLTINALSASSGVIVPMQCEYYALEGLSQLMLTIRKIKKLYNDKLEITGILITMYNGRLILSTQVMDELKKYYSDKLFRTVISRSVRLSESPSYGEPIIYYDKHSKSADEYTAVAKELLRRI